MKCRLMKSWGQLNVRRSSLCLMQACVWPWSWSPSNSVSLSLCLQLLALSQMCVPSGLAPHLGISSYKAGTAAPFVQWVFFAPRHLPWLKTLSYKKKKKKGSLFIVSTAKCSMLCSIYLNIIYAYWHRCGSALEYQSATTTEEEAFQQPDSNSYYDVSHL